MVRFRQFAISRYGAQGNNLLGVYDSSICGRDGAVSPGLSLFLGLLLLSAFFPERVIVHESVEVEGAVQMVGFVFEGLSE